MFSKTTLFGLALLVIPIAYQYWYHYDEYHSVLLNRKQKNKEKEGSMNDRIAIGLNADIDYIISAVDLLKALKGDSTAKSGPPANHQSLSTVEELVEIVSYSMSTCSGIERYFEDKALFDRIVNTASKLKHEEFVGGNAALMANKIAEISPNSKILLAAPVGSKLRQYLNDTIKTVSPPNVREEVHIILEYAKGEEMGGVAATCANRVIISHDTANSRLSSLEVFAQELESFEPTLVILSGLHMLEGTDKNAWSKRLSDVQKVLTKIPRHVPVHLEMATVGNLEFFPVFADTILHYVDSLGLNEQELMSLAKSKKEDFDFDTIGPKPSIPDSGDLLYWLFKTYTDLRDGRGDEKESRLTRVHFHSLSFHILIVPKRELAGSIWTESMMATRLGSRIASLQACQKDEINKDDFELQIPEKFQLSSIESSLKGKFEYSEENGYVAWNRDGAMDFLMIPVHVCKKPLKTVGLGDAISATGLLHSKFSYTERRLRKRVKKPKREGM